MAARIQIPREARRGEVIEIRILIQHPMETGYRHDDVGRLIKRNVINVLSCRYNGVEVFRADLSSGISANPYVQFLYRRRSERESRVQLDRRRRRAGLGAPGHRRQG